MTPFFPRGPGPLLSVLLPTRGRPEKLKAAVASCFDTADDPANVEVRIRVDDDDEATVGTAFALEREYGLHRVRVGSKGPRGNGYLDIHLWLGELAKAACGDWLLLFNDDATFSQKGWDTVLLNAVIPTWHAAPHDVTMLIAETNGYAPSNEFVLIRRKTYEILGHVCGSCYGDNWLLSVMGAVHSASRVSGIKISHPRNEPGMEYGTRDLPTPYWPGEGSFISAGAIHAMQADVQKLLSHIAFTEAKLTWRERPGDDGWYVWRQSGDHPTLHALTAGPTAFLFGSGVRTSGAIAELPGVWARRL